MCGKRLSVELRGRKMFGVGNHAGSKIYCYAALKIIGFVAHIFCEDLKHPLMTSANRGEGSSEKSYKISFKGMSIMKIHVNF